MYEYLGNLRMVGTFSFIMAVISKGIKILSEQRERFLLLAGFLAIIVEIYMINNSKDLQRR